MPSGKVAVTTRVGLMLDRYAGGSVTFCKNPSEPGYLAMYGIYGKLKATGQGNTMENAMIALQIEVKNRAAKNS